MGIICVTDKTVGGARTHQPLPTPTILHPKRTPSTMKDTPTGQATPSDALKLQNSSQNVISKFQSPITTKCARAGMPFALHAEMKTVTKPSMPSDFASKTSEAAIL